MVCLDEFRTMEDAYAASAQTGDEHVSVNTMGKSNDILTVPQKSGDSSADLKRQTSNSTTISIESHEHRTMEDAYAASAETGDTNVPVNTMGKSNEIVMESPKSGDSSIELKRQTSKGSTTTQSTMASVTHTVSSVSQWVSEPPPPQEHHDIIQQKWTAERIVGTIILFGSVAAFIYCLKQEYGYAAIVFATMPFFFIACVCWIHWLEQRHQLEILEDPEMPSDHGNSYLKAGAGDCVESL